MQTNLVKFEKLYLMTVVEEQLFFFFNLHFSEKWFSSANVYAIVCVGQN